MGPKFIPIPEGSRSLSKPFTLEELRDIDFGNFNPRLKEDFDRLIQVGRTSGSLMTIIKSAEYRENKNLRDLTDEGYLLTIQKIAQVFQDIATRRVEEYNLIQESMDSSKRIIEIERNFYSSSMEDKQTPS
jgi:hypothetical protein